MNRPTPDKRALKILFSTYWSSSGWKTNPDISADDFAYAKSAGLMFDSEHLSHDEAVAWALKSRNSVSKELVIDQFLTSLSSRRLDLRSALGSFACGLNFFRHTWREADNPTRFFCPICNMHQRSDVPDDLSILNFERFKWGGVRHTEPIYIGFDLAEAKRNGFASPTAEDREVLDQILETARSLPSAAKPGDLEKELASLLPSNTPERRTLIGILGYCGILTEPSRPNFLETYPRAFERQESPIWKNDWPYPVRWWRGAFGIDERAVGFWFPGLQKSKS